jgi:DNA-binding NarL/FixJ family response regulator
MTTRILIADDQELVRTGLRMIIGSEPDLAVVGEATDGAEAVTAARRLHPDIVLMDIRMPVLDGLEATRRLLADPASGSIHVLVLTTFDQNEYVYRALRAGASGFLLKDMPGDELVAGLRATARGESLLAPAITRRLIEQFTAVTTASPPPWLQELTERELEVLKLLARGLSNQEIADTLIIGEATVKTHVARVLTKLGVRDRVQAVVLAYETGVVTPGSAAPGG